MVFAERRTSARTARGAGRVEPVAVHCCLANELLSCSDGKVYHEMGHEFGPFASAFHVNDRTSVHSFTKLVYRLIDGYRQTLIVHAEQSQSQNKHLQHLCMGYDGLLVNLLTLIFGILKIVNKKAQVQLSCVDIDSNGMPLDQFVEAYPYAPRETYHVKGKAYSRCRVSIWSPQDAARVISLPPEFTSVPATRFLRINVKTEFHGMITVAMVSTTPPQTLSFTRLLLRLSKPAPSVKRCSVVNNMTSEVVQENPLCTVVFVVEQNPVSTLSIAQQVATTLCTIDGRNAISHRSVDDRLEFLRFAVRRPAKNEQNEVPQEATWSQKLSQLAPECPVSDPRRIRMGAEELREAAIDDRVEWLRELLAMRAEHQDILRRDIEGLKRCNLELSRCVTANVNQMHAAARKTAGGTDKDKKMIKSDVHAFDDVSIALRWLQDFADRGAALSPGRRILIDGGCSKMLIRALCCPVPLGIPPVILNAIVCPSLQSITITGSMHADCVISILQRHDFNEIILEKPSIATIETVRRALPRVRRLVLSNGVLSEDLAHRLTDGSTSWVDELCLDRMENLCKVFSVLAGLGLRSLQFRHCLNNESGRLLASWLAVFEGLQSLDVTVNPFDQSVVKHLLQVLPLCSSLKTLLLWTQRRSEWDAKFEEIWVSTKKMCSQVHIGPTERV
eukprot:GEMP01027893.1.p1 GENE.GEMP01027893.1~~GEMP01027893.1.p1  ORF type:complete len:674 (+),score=119.48 GEMP01027893.1:147-2168(+)